MYLILLKCTFLLPTLLEVHALSLFSVELIFCKKGKVWFVFEYQKKKIKKVKIKRLILDQTKYRVSNENRKRQFFEYFYHDLHKKLMKDDFLLFQFWRFIYESNLGRCQVFDLRLLPRLLLRSSYVGKVQQGGTTGS